MCKSCEALMINGVLCHETGCPDAWKDYTKECKWCGTEFEPEEEGQICCSESCYASYMGYPEPEESEEEEWECWHCGEGGFESEYPEDDICPHCGKNMVHWPEYYEDKDS